MIPMHLDLFGYVALGVTSAVGLGLTRGSNHGPSPRQVIFALLLVALCLLEHPPRPRRRRAVPTSDSRVAHSYLTR